MRIFGLIILLLLGIGDDPAWLEKAEQAYNDGDYQKSIETYQLAARHYPEEAPQIRYNIAQCYAKMDSFSTALTYYHQAIASKDTRLASRAYNNIGEILARQEHFDLARKAFANSMKSAADNETARYNYELLAKRLQEVDDPEQDPPPQPQDDPPNRPDIPPQAGNDSSPWQELLDQLVERRRTPVPGDEARPWVHDSLSLPNAMRLLEAMRQDSKPFLQQLKKTYIYDQTSRTDQKPNW